MHMPYSLRAIVWLHVLETTLDLLHSPCIICILISVVLQLFLVKMNHNAVLLRTFQYIFTFLLQSK